MLFTHVPLSLNIHIWFWIKVTVCSVLKSALMLHLWGLLRKLCNVRQSHTSDKIRSFSRQRISRVIWQYGVHMCWKWLRHLPRFTLMAELSHRWLITVHCHWLSAVTVLHSAVQHFTVFTCIFYLQLGVPQQAQRAVHQLRLNRLTSAASYQAFIGRITSPICPHCGSGEETATYCRYLPGI